MKESDAVIFLLSVDSPINQIEIDFLQSTKEYAGKFYFAVNKMDTVSAEDLEAYTSYCAGLLSEIMETSEIKLMPVSAKTGEGVEELKSTILRDSSASINEKEANGYHKFSAQRTSVLQKCDGHALR